MSQVQGKSSGNLTGANKKWGDTTSKKGEPSRVFVGNTDSKTTDCEDLENVFAKYGRIQGIDINSNGFSFVQFSTVQEAQRAMNENGSILKGRKIEVKMFDKSNPQKKKNNGNRPRSRSPNMRNNFGPSMFGPPPVEPPPIHSMPVPQPHLPGNDIEIIAVTKEQWAYAEMIEGRLKRETPIKSIDLLFLHSPQHLSMTLNDLYERRTLYAVVITPVNEEHKSMSLHILHNQTEHRNIPIEAALNLLNEDFREFMIRRGLPLPVIPNAEKYRQNEFDLNRQSSSNGAATYSTSVAAATGLDEKRLPDEISYLLRTTLAEGGVQFLSLPQIDSIIEYFSKERDRLTSQARQQQLRNQTDNPSYPTSNSLQQEDMYSQMQQHQQQQSQSTSHEKIGNSSSTHNQTNSTDSSTTLLDNPQVKAALNSLLQYGTMSNSTQATNINTLASKLMSTYEASGNSAPLPGNYLVGSGNASSNLEAPSYLSTSAGSQQQQQQNMIRRHPLFGTEINPSVSATSSYPNLVGYPQTSQRY